MGAGELAGVIDAALEISEREEEDARHILKLLRSGRDSEALERTKEFLKEYYGGGDDAESRDRTHPGVH